MAKGRNYSSLFQSIGTSLALLISVFALGVSIYEANLLKSQQKALVWPYLTVRPNFSAEGFSLKATNNGTGPAVVKAMEVVYKGQNMTNYDELLNAIKPDRKIGYDYLKMRSLNGTVVRSGETREIFQMPWTEETRQISVAMMNVEVRIGYCSVLDECWVYSAQKDDHEIGELKTDEGFQN